MQVPLKHLKGFYRFFIRIPSDSKIFQGISKIYLRFYDLNDSGTILNGLKNYMEYYKTCKDFKWFEKYFERFTEFQIISKHFKEFQRISGDT